MPIVSLAGLVLVVVASGSSLGNPRAQADAVTAQLAAAVDDARPEASRSVTSHSVAGPASVSPDPVDPAPVSPVPLDPAPVAAAAVPVVAPRPPAPPSVEPAPDHCAVALAYLAAHAAPGFAHYCRPGPLHGMAGPSAAFTCVPGTEVSCPDGVPEIVIGAPECAASYKNEASNSNWDFSTGGIIEPGTVQGSRTWDPFGPCPMP